MITIQQIQALRREAGEHGDIAQVHICSVALRDQEPVTTATAFEDRYGGGGLSSEERAAIMGIASQGAAWAECERVIAEAAARG